MTHKLLTAGLAVAVCCAATAATPARKTAHTPRMGWSSWNTYHVNISDSLIISQADALVATGLAKAGYHSIGIDDGFFGHRAPDGQMVPHETRFPQGMARVAKHIHTLGLEAGIYSDAGRHTCGSRYDNDPNGFGAGLYGHEHQDARTYFRQWGYDYIKIDYCGAGQVLDLPEQERYEAIARAFAEEGAGSVGINVCRWAFPGTWASRMAESWRVSPDIRPRWKSVAQIMDCNMYLSAYCSPGHYNDMDMLEVGRGMKPEEDEAHFGLWCLMSSPLLIGCDLTAIAPSTLALLTNPELIALNQDTLGLQARVIQRDGGTYVLAKDLYERQGRVRAVALYNPTDTAARFAVATSALELGGRVRLRDLTARRDLPAVADTLAATVGPHSALILKAEGRTRLEPRRYEAEWAYCPMFDALGKRKRPIGPAECQQASGGIVVRNIGGQSGNTLSWRDVYSRHGGRYSLYIYYLPAAHRSLELAVNGGEPQPVATDDSGEMKAAAVTVSLKAGMNTITIGHPYEWTPDIDRIELRPL